MCMVDGLFLPQSESERSYRPGAICLRL